MSKTYVQVTDSKYVGRLAPSPTGALHLGNARTFLITWLRARQAGGRLIMRMEDLDHPRVKPHTVEQAYDDLRWLGLDWDGEEFVQSTRMQHYHAAYDKLLKENFIYPCACTRAEIEAAQSAPHAGEEMRYPNTCRDINVSAENIRAWRFRVADDHESEFHDEFCGVHTSRLHDWSGDFVVAKSRDLPAYQLAVVVDDAQMGVTEVIRADDLLLSTHRQLILYNALNLTPPKFVHVPLVVGEDGRRLAKRHGDTRISHIREAGKSPETVIGWLAWTLGLCEFGENMSAESLISNFDLASVPEKQIIVNRQSKNYLGV